MLLSLRNFCDCCKTTGLTIFLLRDDKSLKDVTPKAQLEMSGRDVKKKASNYILDCFVKHIQPTAYNKLNVYIVDDVRKLS